VVKTGDRIISHEFHSDLRVLKINRERIPTGFGGACVPLYTEDEIVGVIFVIVSLPREITADEVHILNALAGIGGNAIHRMRLSEQTLKQVERLKSLRTIDLAISSSLDLNVSIKIVLDQIIAQLKVDAVAILLHRPETTGSRQPV
jgi:GAF domain-containing protein